MIAFLRRPSAVQCGILAVSDVNKFSTFCKFIDFLQK